MNHITTTTNNNDNDDNNCVSNMDQQHNDKDSWRISVRKTRSRISYIVSIMAVWAWRPKEQNSNSRSIDLSDEYNAYISRMLETSRQNIADVEQIDPHWRYQITTLSTEASIIYPRRLWCHV